MTAKITFEVPLRLVSLTTTLFSIFINDSVPYSYSTMNDLEYFRVLLQLKAEEFSRVFESLGGRSEREVLFWKSLGVWIEAYDQHTRKEEEG
jgi:hypothetical protein